MSLPSYVINFDELLPLLQEALSNVVIRSLKDVQGSQMVRGFSQHIPALQGEYIVLRWILDTNIILTGVTFSQSAWKSEDYWELWIDGDRLMETVYTKELGDQKHWEVLNPVNYNQEIMIVLHNNSGNSRDVWVDIEYIKLLGNEPSNP